MSFYLDSATAVEKRLNDPRNILSENGFKAIGKGQAGFRGTGERKEYRKLSIETKGLVAALAQVSGTKETSKTFGVQPVITNRLKNGMTSDGNKADTELRKETKSVLDSIGVQASNLVQESLARLLNPSRLTDAKTPELTQIAGVAMNILEKASPQKNSFIAGRIVFMVPQAKETSDFEVIDVIPTRE
jgi:hypothetical protein